MPVSDIIELSVSRETASPTLETFNVPLILAPHNVGTERVQTYHSLKEMSDALFPSDSPAYLCASAIFSQTPSVATVKVAKQSRAPAHKVSLKATGAATGVVYSLRVNGTLYTYTALPADTNVTVTTALEALVAADTKVWVSSVGATDTMVLENQHKLSVGTGTTGTVYTVVVNGATYTYTRLLADTNTTVATALAALIDASASVQSTSTAGDVYVHAQASQSLGVTISVPSGGNLTHSPAYMVRVSAWTDNLEFTDTSPATDMATELAEVLAADSNWFGLSLGLNTSEDIPLAATFCATAKKLLVYQSSDNACGTSATTDPFSVTKFANYEWSAGIFSNKSNWDFRAAAWMSKNFTYTPGSETWAFKTLASISTDKLSSTQVTNLQSKNATTYLSTVGLNMTEGGKVSSGEWIDIIRFVAWLESVMKSSTVAMFANAKKVPYTDLGGDMISSVISAVLTQGENAGGLVPGLSTVTVPKVATIPSSTRATRVFPDIKFSGRLQGAIHKILVQGTVSV